MNQLYAVRSTTTNLNLEVFLGEYESLGDAVKRANIYSKEYGYATISHEVFGISDLYISNDEIQFEDGIQITENTFINIHQNENLKYSHDFRMMYSELKKSIGQEYGVPDVERIREREITLGGAKKMILENSRQLRELLNERSEYQQLQKDNVEVKERISNIEDILRKVNNIRFSKEMINVTREQNNALNERKENLGLFGRLTQSRTLSAEIANNNAKIFHYAEYARETLYDISNGNEGQLLQEALSEAEIFGWYSTEYGELLDDHSYTLHDPKDFSSLEIDHSNTFEFENELLNEIQKLDASLKTLNERMQSLENPERENEIDVLKHSLMEDLGTLKSEDLNKLYAEALVVDVEGWSELEATKVLTGISSSDFYSAYIIDDLHGRFEAMNGDRLTKYYEKLKFGEWEHKGIIGSTYEDGDYILDENNPEYVKYLEEKKIVHCQKILERYPEEFIDAVDIEKILDISEQDEVIAEEAIDEQMSKDILNKVVETYPYNATVSEAFGKITIFDEDPLIGEEFNSYEEALQSELHELNNGEVLANVVEKVSLTEHEQEYLKDNYGVDVDDYKALANQRVILNDAKDKLLQLMDTDSHYRDEKLILTQQKVVDQELMKFKVIERKIDTVRIPKQPIQPTQSIPIKQAFSIAMNYSLADEVGYLKFVEELDEQIAAIGNPSQVTGELVIRIDGEEILATDNISLSEIKEKFCTGDTMQLLKHAKEMLREKISNGEDIQMCSKDYEHILEVEKGILELQQADELIVSESISIG